MIRPRRTVAFVVLALGIATGARAQQQPSVEQKLKGFDEYMAQVLKDWNVRTTGIYTKNFDLRRTETIAIPYSAYSVPITNPDPGFDGKLGTSDDPGRSITYYEYPTTLSGVSASSAARAAKYPLSIHLPRRFSSA